MPVGAVTVLGIAVAGGHGDGRPVAAVPRAAPVAAEQQLAAGQLVMTLTDRGPGIGRVRFTVGGNRGARAAWRRLRAAAARPVGLARRLPALVDPPLTG